jgi:hypothetical protein
MCGDVAVTAAVSDLLIRSFGQAVQDRPEVSALWVDVPDLSTHADVV